MGTIFAVVGGLLGLILALVVLVAGYLAIMWFAREVGVRFDQDQGVLKVIVIVMGTIPIAAVSLVLAVSIGIWSVSTSLTEIEQKGPALVEQAERVWRIFVPAEVIEALNIVPPAPESTAVPPAPEPTAQPQAPVPTAQPSSLQVPQNPSPGDTLNGCFYSAMCGNQWVVRGSCTICTP